MIDEAPLWMNTAAIRQPSNKIHWRHLPTLLRVCVMAAPPHPANKAVSAFVPHSATALHTWATPGLKPARRAVVRCHPKERRNTSAVSMVKTIC